MSGVFANTGTVILGSLIGLLFKKAIPKSLADMLMQALGLCTLFIGIQGAMKGQNPLIMILSVVIGTLIGTLLRLDDGLSAFGNRIEKKFTKKDTNSPSIAQGFVTSSLVFCVGAMTIVGSLRAGLRGDNTMLYTKSLLDLVSSCVFASTLGFGVMLSSLFVFVFQGAIVLLAGVVAPLLGNEILINEMTCAGSILIIGIGMNLLGITKIKIMNMLPAMFIPIILYQFV
ncbi:MAG: DUF554 domain-containing protein [Clostridia bacterium]|nr:DUF554 domain-containing protein [Clostridia bacterium]